MNWFKKWFTKRVNLSETEFAAYLTEITDLKRQLKQSNNLSEERRKLALKYKKKYTDLENKPIVQPRVRDIMGSEYSAFIFLGVKGKDPEVDIGCNENSAAICANLFYNLTHNRLTTDFISKLEAKKDNPLIQKFLRELENIMNSEAMIKQVMKQEKAYFNRPVVQPTQVFKGLQ